MKIIKILRYRDIICDYENTRNYLNAICYKIKENNYYIDTDELYWNKIGLCLYNTNQCETNVINQGENIKIKESSIYIYFLKDYNCEANIL